ncbi:lytic transglycosylase domain-containing protein [Streptomyces sp. NPDC020800]|uniref:lytic transglycosylase domain-containing protein n=1 Tax=Streptomyces sp. NPDC020800 TaxID=3365092 RepID=UPI0037B32B5E
MATHFGRWLYKRVATTAMAAAAVATLSASQAPDVIVGSAGRQTTAGATPSLQSSFDGSATGNSPYYTDLPPLNSPNPSPSPTIGMPVPHGEAEAGIPATVLDAYKKAEAELRTSKPGCNLPWQLLAAIGKVESGQARGGDVDASGTTLSPILGPALVGTGGFARILNSDGTYAHAIGPMQFLSTTWQWAGRDGNGDGLKDPNNVYDAALAAGHYLCRNGWDLSIQADTNSAILSYNDSRDYLNTVLSWYEYYRKGTHSVPDGTGALPSHRSNNSRGADSKSSSKPPKKPKAHKPVPTPPKPGTPPPTPPATDTVDHLADAGTAELTAMASHPFTARISTSAVTKADKPVARVRVRFVVLGDTDTTFTGGETAATVATNSKGVATAPMLQAGERSGDFTVRALVVGRLINTLDYQATVTLRVADTLTRTSDTPLTCTPGGEFANQIEVKATYKGAVADKVAATATLIKSSDDAIENDKGPYFKDKGGKSVRTLMNVVTDANGALKLPNLYADDTIGTFLLRITTTGGATLDVQLTVAAAEPSTDPSPSPSSQVAMAD